MAKNITLPLPTSLVAFVDILGFTERVLRIETATELKALDKNIRAVQRHFEVGTIDPSTRESHQISRKEVLAFSDCIVLSTSLDSDLARSEGTFDALMSEILSLALSQASCLGDGVFVRGAVDLGFWHSARNRLISPALARAYRLEGDAVVPVIRLSEGAMKFFRSHTHRYFYSQDYDPVPSSFLIYKDMLTGQSFWFIDYMNVTINNLDWRPTPETHRQYMAAPPEKRSEIMNQGYQANVRRWLKFHRDTVLRSYQRAENSHVKLKYRWLAKYHNTIAGQYKFESRTVCIAARDIAPLGDRYRIDRLPRHRASKSKMLAMLKEQQRLELE